MTAETTQAGKVMAAKTAAAVRRSRLQCRGAADPPSTEEPLLVDMLRDPIMQRLMTSDGITRSQLLTLVAAARSRLRREFSAD